MNSEKPIGEVYRYYENDGIVYIILYDSLTAGQTLHFIDPEGDYFVTPELLQVAHQDVHQAYSGDYVGIHVDRPLKQHDKVLLQI